MFYKIRVQSPPLAYLLFILMTVLYVIFSPFLFCFLAAKSVVFVFCRYGWLLVEEFEDDLRKAFYLIGITKIEQELRGESINWYRGRNERKKSK